MSNETRQNSRFITRVIVVLLVLVTVGMVVLATPALAETLEEPTLDCVDDGTGALYETDSGLTVYENDTDGTIDEFYFPAQETVRFGYQDDGINVTGSGDAEVRLESGTGDITCLGDIDTAGGSIEFAPDDGNTVALDGEFDGFAFRDVVYDPADTTTDIVYEATSIETVTIEETGLSDGTDVIAFDATDDSEVDSATVVNGALTFSDLPNPEHELYLSIDETAGEIEDWYDLDDVRDDLDGEYVLVNDLDEDADGYDDVASETANDGDGFEPIGDSADNSWTEGNETFNGTFDGNDRTIANLTIDRDEADFVGLFGVIGSEGTVSDLTLESATVEANDWAGGLSGQNWGTVSNLTLESATVTGNDDVGGLLGENRGTVSDVSVSTDVAGSGYTGGAIGNNFGGTITGATVEGTVFSKQDVGLPRVGGIVGHHHSGSSIDSSSFTNGTVDGEDENIGGIAGYADGSPITNSSANGTIGNEDADSVGGLAGRHFGDLSDSYSTATVRGNDTVGGVVGDAVESDIERTYAVGEVDGGGDDVGGLVGIGKTGIGYNFNIENSYWDTETTGVNESFDSEEDGLTTDEMTGADATEHMDGFGFPDGDDRWHAVEDDYPALEWEDTDPVYGVEITGTNSAIDEGETLEVDATVTNLGADGDEQSIELRDFAGDEVDTDTVTLTSGESTERTLEWDTEVGEGGLDDVTVASENHTDTRTVSIGAGEVVPDCQPIDTEGAYELNDDIEASGECIEIEADDISLDGNDHTISGSGTGIVVNYHSNVTITNVTLSGLDVGIEMTDIEDATVEHNTVEGSDEDGLVFEDVQDTTIANNTVTGGATSGIHLADATDTAVENNTVRENDESGMYVVDSEELVVSGNEVVDNGEDDEDELSHDIEDAGIYLLGTADSTLEANNLTANAQAALFLEESSTDNDLLKNSINVSAIGDGKQWNAVLIEDSSGNTLSDSVISSGEVGSLSDRPEYFIYVYSAETVVKDNEIDGHARAGIDIRGESNTVDNNSIAGSFLRSDAQNGHAIRVDATDEDWSVTNNSLNGAEILHPERAGVAITGDQTVEIQNNTGTKLDSDLSTDPGTDLELTFVEQSVENQQITTPVGDTTLTFTGAGLRLDGVNEPPNAASPDDVEPTDYYFEVENTSDEFTFENLELDYNESDLQIDETVLPETLSLWQLNGGEWEEIENSGVDTDEQVVTGNVTEPGLIGVFGEDLFADGDGSAENPYVIENWEHLDNVRYVLDANFTLDNDLDEETEGYGGDGEDGVVLNADGDLIDGDGFEPIGDFGDEFNGSFDGSGHTIENLTIDRETENNVGLFGAVESAGTLENVSLENVDIMGDVTVGGLAGETGGAVRNVSVSGTVTGASNFVGSITGLNFEGAMVDISTTADVEGASFVGGIAGESQDESRSVTASGDVEGDNNVGGLIGNSVDSIQGDETSNITDAVATGTVNGAGDAVGGLVGLQVDGVITRSTATGSVDGDSDTGGLVGQNNGALITESTATGDVSGNEFGTGGLLGWNNGGTVSNASASGTVEGNGEVGGLVGENNGIVTTSYAVGVVDDEENADESGGLIGEDDGTITNSYWDTEATGESSSDGGTGLTTDEMTGLNATGNMDGFVFPNSEGTWHATEDYPALAWEDTGSFFGVTIEETNAPVEEGDTLDVTTNVTNWAADGEQTVTLTDTEFSDAQQDSTSIALDSGEDEEHTLEWETEPSNAGTGDITVASENDTATEKVTVEVVVESVDAEVTVDEATADGADEVEFTVTTTDANDKPVEGITVAVTDSEDVSDLGGIDGGDEATTGSDGEATFTATSTEIGEFTIEFEEQQNDNTETAIATFVAGSPDTVSVDVTEDVAVADGVEDVAFGVTVEDAFDNPVEGVTVETTDDGTDIDYGDDKSLETNESGQVTVTVTSTTAQEDVTFTFEEQDENTETTATATFEVGDPAEVSYEADPADETVVADGDDAIVYTVTVTDANDNPVADVAVETDASDGDALDINDDGDVTSETTDSDGEVEFTVTSTTAQEDVEITFTEQQEANKETVSATFVAGSPENVSVDVVADEAVADGQREVEFNIIVTDKFDTPVEDVAVETTDDGADIDYAGDDSRETDEDGQVTVTATSTTAQEDVTFTFEEQEENTETTATATFEAGTPASIDAEVTADNALADGQDEAEFTVTIEDENDNPVEGATVEVDDASGLTDLAGETNETDAEGETTFTATSTDASEFTVTFSETDAGTDSATVTFEVGDPSEVSYEADPADGTVVADGGDAITYTVVVTDANDNPVADVTVETDGSDGDALDINDDGDVTTETTDPDGEVEFTVTSTTAQEDVEITFTEQQEATEETASATFEAGEPASVSVETDVETAVADGDDEVEFTVTVEDAFDNPVAGVLVETTDDGTGIDYAGDDSQETDENGQVTVTATSTTAQEDVTFTFEEQEENTEAAAEAAFQAGTPVSISAEVTVDEAIADGQDDAEFTVTIDDENDNPVKGATVEVDDASGLADLGGDTNETDAEGETTFTATSTDAGEFTVTFSETDAGTDSATVTFESGDPAEVSYEADPGNETVVADGGDAITYTVVVTDANDNPVPEVIVEADASDGDALDINDDGDVTSETTDADGEIEFSVTSTTAQEDVEITFTEQQEATEETASATFVTGSPDNVSVDVIADEAVADGQDEVEFEVSVTDEFDNPVEDVEAETTDDGADIDYAGDDSRETDEDGQVTVTATSTTAQDDVTFTFEEQEENTEATVEATFEAGTPASIDVEVIADEAVADGQDEVEFEVTVTDEFDNPVPGATIDVDDAEDVAELDGIDAGDTETTDSDGEAKFTATSTAAGEFTVRFSEATAGEQTATTTFDAPATFEVAIEETTSPVIESETLEVTATVTNVGDRAGTQTVTLSDTDFSDETQDEAEITLDVDEAEEDVVFEWETGLQDPGAGNVTVSSEDDDAPVNVTVNSELSIVPFGAQFADGEAGDDYGEVDIDVEMTPSVDPEDINATLEIEGDEEGVIYTEPGEHTTGTTFVFDVGEIPEADTYTATVTAQEANAETVMADEQFELVVPATAELSELAVAGQGTDGEIEVGEDEDVAVLVTNVGEVADEFEITLDIGDSEVTETASTDELGAGEDELVTFEDVTGTLGAGEYDVTVTSDDDAVSGNLTVLEPPEFLITDVTSESTGPGDTVEITATVENVGEATGTQPVELRETTEWSQYANDRGVVESPGLLVAIFDWRNDELSTNELLTVIDAWRDGESVDGDVIEVWEPTLDGGEGDTYTFTDEPTGTEDVEYRVRTADDGVLVTVELT